MCVCEELIGKEKEKRMVDREMVCCMCGDIGFPEKLFRCNNCRNRFQHSYCSNYYTESAEPIDVCDWCHSEGRTPSKRPPPPPRSAAARSEYSGDRIIKNHHEDADKPKHASPRPTTRRYKLLKDVMC